MPSTTSEPSNQRAVLCPPALRALRLEKRAQAEKDRKVKEEQDAAKAAAELNGPKARSLPLPQGATNVEYEKLTGQIRCKCPSDVVTTANYLAQQFNAQGRTAGKDLIRTKSAIIFSPGRYS